MLFEIIIPICSNALLKSWPHLVLKNDFEVLHRLKGYINKTPKKKISKALLINKLKPSINGQKSQFDLIYETKKFCQIFTSTCWCIDLFKIVILHYFTFIIILLSFVYLFFVSFFIMSILFRHILFPLFHCFVTCSMLANRTVTCITLYSLWC